MKFSLIKLSKQNLELLYIQVKQCIFNSIEYPFCCWPVPFYLTFDNKVVHINKKIPITNNFNEIAHSATLKATEQENKTKAIINSEKICKDRSVKYIVISSLIKRKGKTEAKEMDSFY